jgi:hypothetical protein
MPNSVASLFIRANFGLPWLAATIAKAPARPPVPLCLGFVLDRNEVAPRAVLPGHRRKDVNGQAGRRGVVKGDDLGEHVQTGRIYWTQPGVRRQFVDALRGLGHGCRRRAEARADRADARQADAAVGSAQGAWIESLTDTDELRQGVPAERVAAFIDAADGH